MTFCIRRCRHGNENHAQIANPPNSAKLHGTTTIPPTYIRVRAEVWKCGEGQTDKHIDGPGQGTFRLGYVLCEM